MKFYSLLLAFLVILCAQVQAQNTSLSTPKLGISVETGVATGNISDINTVELGGTLSLQCPVNKNVALIFTTGYYNILGKDFVNPTAMIPIKAGFKAFLTPGLYFSGEGGAGIQMSDIGSYPGDTYHTPRGVFLLLSPGMGHTWSAWDAGIRYENFSQGSFNFGMISLHLAYQIVLK